LLSKIFGRVEKGSDEETTIQISEMNLKVEEIKQTKALLPLLMTCY
jgi:hypothetical protein